MKPKFICFYLILFFMIFASTAFAQEENKDSLTITTYYPPPYGVYRNLKLNPTTDAPSGPAAGAGVMYFDNNPNMHMIRYHNGTGWVNLTEQIAPEPSYWLLSGTNIYNNNTGFVGINTQNPQYSLHVVGDIKASGEVCDGSRCLSDCRTSCDPCDSCCDACPECTPTTCPECPASGCLSGQSCKPNDYVPPCASGESCKGDCPASGCEAGDVCLPQDYDPPCPPGTSCLTQPQPCSTGEPCPSCPPGNTCQPPAASCGVCKTPGPGGTCVPITGYNEGPGCTGTCKGCLSGACINIPAGMQDTYGDSTCTYQHYRCNGSGACTAPRPCMTCIYGQRCPYVCSGWAYPEVSGGSTCDYGGCELFGNDYCDSRDRKCSCWQYP